jgi:hypothetical protein
MRKKGPKPSGVVKVAYYRRVVPDLVGRLDSIIDGLPDGSCFQSKAISEPAKVAMATVVSTGEIESLRNDNKALLDGAEIARLRIEELEKKLDRCSRASDSEKLAKAYRIVDELKAKIGNKGQWDQT